MDPSDANSLAAFEHLADLRFRNEVADVYDSVMDAATELVEEYSNAGIASARRFSEKTAGLIVAKFKTVAKIFEEVYIQPLEKLPAGITEGREQWLRQKIESVIDEQTRRAQLLTEQLCGKFQPQPQLSDHVARIQGQRGELKRRLGDAITLAKTNRDSSGMTPVNDQLVSPKSLTKSENPPPGSLLIFISHSSKDASLAESLIDLLKAALGLFANQIRCSSVDGYRLPFGVNTESKLREEVNAVKVVIGLITRSSLNSDYVMFELGARWGSGLFLAPLLAGVNANELSGPLSLLNALSAENEAHLHQLVGDISLLVGLPVQNPASYVRHVTRVKQLAESLTTAVNGRSAPAFSAKAELKISISTAGEPPSQLLKVAASRQISISRVEYMLSNETCIVGEDMSLQGETLEVPLSSKSLTALWNTPRADKNDWDHSGPAKIALAISVDGRTRQYILPVHMDDVMVGNTMYRRLYRD